MNLKEIIIGCKKQNLACQKALYNLYGKKLFHLSLKYCNSFEEAEDNLHDSFITIFSTIQQFENKGTFEGWMKRITINKAISKIKSTLQTKPLESIIYPIAETEIDVNSEEIPLDYLLKIIQELPNQYRLVFSLYELDDYSHHEIAEMLGISEGTSKSNLYKAKVILKNKILEIKPKKSKNGI